MGRSQETFGKKEKEKKRLKKRKEKLEKKAERKANSAGGGLDNMIAWVDENGNFTDTPPDPTLKTEIDASTIDLNVPKREEEETVKTGVVEFFNTEKGFGFIKEKGTGEKFFVHVHGLIDTIAENDTVTFELERGLKGMNAVRVTIVKP